MDFPEYLESYLTNGSFVSSTEELHQTMRLLLLNPIGSFLQDPRLGSRVAIHATDEDAMVEGVISTLEQIKGVTVVNCYKEQDNIHATYQYMGELSKFTFNIGSV